MKKKIFLTVSAFVVLIFLAWAVGRGGFVFLGGSDSKPADSLKILPAENQRGEGAYSLEQEGKFKGQTETQESASLSKRLIIFNRTLTLEVKDVKKIARVIEKMAEDYGGYVYSLRFGTGGDEVPLERGQLKGKEIEEGVIVVKIPAEKCSQFSRKIKGLGELIEDAESAEEVTDQYVDISARLRNLKREETRLLEIFDSAKNVTEMLQVERELQRIRGEIESLTAQKINLEKSAQMAVFTIHLRTPQAIVSPADRNWGFREALRKAVRNFVYVVQGLIILIGTLLPLLIFGFFVYAGWKSWLAVKARIWSKTNS